MHPPMRRVQDLGEASRDRGRDADNAALTSAMRHMDAEDGTAVETLIGSEIDGDIARVQTKPASPRPVTSPRFGDPRHVE